jgi:hypothetical protein
MLIGPLKFVLFFEELEEREPLAPSCEINRLRAAIHPINFWTSWRLLDGFILVITDTFSGFGSISHRRPYT